MAKQQPRKLSKEEVIDSQELEILQKEIEKQNPSIFNKIPDNQRKELIKSVTVSVKQKFHSGPLPDPETLTEYNAIIPDGANRIMNMAEKQQIHRMAMEDFVIKSQSSQSQLGQFFGFIIGLVVIGCGTYLAINDHEYVGGALITSTLVSLVSIFVLGKKSQRESLDR